MKNTNSITDSIKDVFGNDVKIVSKIPVSGGDINSAYKVELSNKESLFLKENKATLSDMFYGEAQGLLDIAATNTLNCPTPIAFGVDSESGKSFLLLSHVQSAKKEADYWYNFGVSLAKMHLSGSYTPCSDDPKLIYGGSYDNYIGFTSQENTPSKSWVDFFRDHRLRPQFSLAYPYYKDVLYKKGEALMDNLGDYIEEPSLPSLLHGDLWGGNAMTGNDGKAWLIDPASYIGHNEVDLAMTQLFGSFPSEFYKGYDDIFPISDNYETHKMVYNLYQLLNHLNMFGTGYLPSVMGILNDL